MKGELTVVNVLFSDEKEEEKEEAGDHYLHPSLLASNQQPVGSMSRARANISNSPLIVVQVKGLYAPDRNYIINNGHNTTESNFLYNSYFILPTFIYTINVIIQSEIVVYCTGHELLIKRCFSVCRFCASLFICYSGFVGMLGGASCN